MSEYFTIVAFKDHACGEAYYQECQTTTDFDIAISIALKYVTQYDHVCIIPYEHRHALYCNRDYTKILPYAIDMSLGDKVNVNKLLTLLKIT